MMNEKALEAAAKAICNRVAAKAAIEAYLATLPDEDRLVEEARVEAGVWEGETEPAEANPEVLTSLLNRLADALEAARAKAAR